jgi:hypothetical protein
MHRQAFLTLLEINNSARQPKLQTRSIGQKSILQLETLDGMLRPPHTHLKQISYSAPVSNRRSQFNVTSSSLVKHLVCVWTFDAIILRQDDMYIYSRSNKTIQAVCKSCLPSSGPLLNSDGPTRQCSPDTTGKNFRLISESKTAMINCSNSTIQLNILKDKRT